MANMDDATTNHRKKKGTPSPAIHGGHGKLFRAFNLFTVISVLSAIGFYAAIRFSTVETWADLFSRMPGSYQVADTNRDLFQLIESRRFHYERHFVPTADGYILQLVRLVNPYLAPGSNGTTKRRKGPVLLHHGYQCSATVWLVARDGRLDDQGRYREWPADGEQAAEVGASLGFVLSAAGYDVWLANYRGGIYSVNHTEISVESWQFWQFTIDEMIRYDLPAEIDYILATTGRPTLSYIGHSQGSLMMLALMSQDDRHAQAIRPFIAMSPVFNLAKADTSMRHMRHIEPWLLRRFAAPMPGIPNINRFMGNLFSNRYTRKIFLAIMYGFVGMQEENLVADRLPVYSANVMMGSSTWNTAQIVQSLANAGPTARFDYGREKNQQIYGQPEPPQYDVGQINSTHVALFYTARDTFCHLDNIKYLKQRMKVALLEDYQIPDHNWNHMDLVWAKNVGPLVNEKVLHILSRY